VISGVQFKAFGAVTSLNHLGVTESRTYNLLGQMTRMTKGSLIDVEYRFSATANDGKIVSQKNWLSGEDVTYQYDELERLISASTTAGTSWGLSWAYDGFGNRLSQTVTQGSGPSSVTLVNGNTNRISSAGYSYDSNGNMTQMPKSSGSMTLDYDLSNRLSGVSHPDGTEQYRYAPDNRRVWRSAGKGSCLASRGNDQEFYWGGFNGYGNTGEWPTEQVILYSPGGQKMGAYCLGFSPNMQYIAVTASEENVYYGGRMVGKRIAALSVANSGLVSAFTADRLQSKGNGSNYYPYGESKTSTAGDDREGFATYTRDEKSGLDYADQRWYASGVGRFTTPDPYMADAGGAFALTRPSSWGKYGYVEANPISYFDPAGLMINKPPEAPSTPMGPSTRNVLGDGVAEPEQENQEGKGGGPLVWDATSTANSLAALVRNGNLSDCEAMGEFFSGAIGHAGSSADRASLSNAYRILTPQDPRVPSSFGVASTSAPTFLNSNSSQSGYSGSYRESDTADQGHHFALFFQIGLNFDRTGAVGMGSQFVNATILSGLTEAIQLITGGSSNFADFKLGVAAYMFGVSTAIGDVTPANAKAAFEASFCDKSRSKRM